MKATPSFQFFAMSEEGINLYVDLNSSLSEWINNMKDEVQISRKGHQKPMTISNHIRGLTDVDEHKKIPSFGTRMNLSSDGVERIPRCTNSSLSSAVSEIHSEACTSDPTAITSRASELTSSTFTNQMFSLSRITNFDIQKHMAFDVASCPKEGTTSSQYSVDASFRMKNSNTVVFDVSIKPVPEGTRISDLVDCHFLKVATVHPSNVGVSVSDSTLITVTEKNNLSVIKTSEHKMTFPDICNTGNDGNNCQVPIGNELAEGFANGEAQ